MSLLAELRRRNVIRVAGLYLVGAWLVVQVAGTLLPMFEAPAWLARSIVIVLAIGFVPALVLAWVFELTPQGLQRDQQARIEPALAAATARRMDRAIMVVLVAALAYFAIDKFVRVPQPSPVAPAPPPAAESPAPAAVVATAIPRKSIAVLPFADLSPAHDQEYFSDGMAEEILNALARVKDLKVAGRTSAFSFKGRNEDLRAIGRALSVAHVLEGSVRKQGDRVRITAQLVQTEDGYHLWSESFDGDLHDVFELQERIARAIAEQLQLVLMGAQQQRLVSAGTTNPEAYALYLQASGIFNRRDGARYAEGMTQLEQAIALDPQFARAHARLAAMLALAPIYLQMPDYVARVEQHAHAASTLDPALAEPYAALAMAHARERQYEITRNEFERALVLDPNDLTTRFWYAITLVQLGYTRRGDAELDRVLELDPMLPNALFWRAQDHLQLGEFEAGERLLRRAADAGLAFAGMELAALAHRAGNDAEATALLVAGYRSLRSGLPEEDAERIAHGVYGDAAARAAALETIEGYVAQAEPPLSSVVVRALLDMGEPKRALEITASHPTNNDALFLAALWGPKGDPVRATPAFIEFARRMGWPAVWDREGAPDRCRRKSMGEYQCH
jgi:TolB-like protein